MTWPSVAVDTTDADAGTDNPAQFRLDILDALQKLNEMIAHDVASRTAVETLTNKRITKRVVSMADGVSVTPTGDTADVNIHTNTQAAGTLTVNAPSGTPTDGQPLVLRLKSTNAHAFSWNAIYRGPLPARMRGGSEVVVVELMYNSADAKWDYAPPQRGKQTAWVPAIAMVSRSSNGPTIAQGEYSTNKIMLNTLDYANDATVRGAQFSVAMPKGWDASTVVAKFHWTKTTGTGDVVWQIQAFALGDNEAIDAAWGTAVTVTDTALSDNFEHVTADSAAITIASAAAARNRILFQVLRDAAHASDTFTGTAKLLGVEVTVNLHAADDA